MSKKEEIKNCILNSIGNKPFIINDIQKQFPNGNLNTLRTIISRDLVIDGFIKTIGKKYKGGPQQYQVTKFIGKTKNKWNYLTGTGDTPIYPHVNSEEIPRLDYSSIGIAIEELIQKKNQTIQNLKNEVEHIQEEYNKEIMKKNNELNETKNQLLKGEETIQELERHINHQIIKIRELNDQLRNRSSKGIKLDELQETLQSAVQKTTILRKKGE